MSVSMYTVALINWSHESHELSWDNPVKVTILNFFVMFILLCIEGFEVVPAEANTFLKTFEAVKHCTFVEAVTLACISERFESLVINLELSKSLLCVHLQNYDHKCAHQEASIGNLGWISTAAVVIDSGLTLE